ncbi:L-2-hydroxyglutarate oxidase [Sinomonas sp. ASV486]|uniref:L-2-hydroxyglutarate oxidase n=1 Tax=Sinomonas sp. ASV486 TaxID=3051170 RepID=UPI0027DCD556|nr:L-2-hydroxyglutarate oxidase [Sinomonas sp. ASV486]MDQ4490804.1 L-2-hydroxyglutarate oxidase [Sinomonas sp. ASV486]
MYDFGVVGGGIVGLATAMTLLKDYPGASLLLIEKEDRPAAHQTGHNSGVIHSGIYYEPGSMKARFSKAGEAMTKAFCREHGLDFDECGKLIVAADRGELGRMSALEERAAVHGIQVERLGPSGLESIEPRVRGAGALFVPSTAIVDYGQVSRRMAEIVLELGGVIRLGEEVRGIRESASSVAIETARGSHTVSQLVVAAGLQSDRVARLAGLRPAARIVPFRGEYYRLSERLGRHVRHLVYPVPDPSLPFLGVHLSPTVHGTITVGPNAVLGLSREGYPKLSFSGRDVLDYLRFRGFWRMAGKNLRVGVAEMRNSVFRRGYLEECRRYSPSLGFEDLEPYPAGIRAQAVAPDGTLVHDFVLLETERMLHVVNAPSPAATAALPIAAELAGRLRRSRSRGVW